MLNTQMANPCFVCATFLCEQPQGFCLESVLLMHMCFIPVLSAHFQHFSATEK